MVLLDASFLTTLSLLSNHTIDDCIIFASDAQYIVLTVTEEPDDRVGEEDFGKFGGLGLQGP
jgi:hypothetical protein